MSWSSVSGKVSREARLKRLCDLVACSPKGEGDGQVADEAGENVVATQTRGQSLALSVVARACNPRHYAQRPWPFALRSRGPPRAVIRGKPHRFSPPVLPGPKAARRSALAPPLTNFGRWPRVASPIPSLTLAGGRHAPGSAPRTVSRTRRIRGWRWRRRSCGVAPVWWRVNCFRDCSPHPLRGGYRDSAPSLDRRS